MRQPRVLLHQRVQLVGAEPVPQHHQRHAPHQRPIRQIARRLVPLRRLLVVAKRLLLHLRHVGRKGQHGARAEAAVERIRCVPGVVALRDLARVEGVLLIRGRGRVEHVAERVCERDGEFRVVRHLSRHDAVAPGAASWHGHRLVQTLLGNRKVGELAIGADRVADGGANAQAKGAVEQRVLGEGGATVSLCFWSGSAALVIDWLERESASWSGICVGSQLCGAAWAMAMLSSWCHGELDLSKFY